MIKSYLFLKSEIQASISKYGDTYGQYIELLKLFEIWGHPPETIYLILGDYIDRGNNQLK